MTTTTELSPAQPASVGERIQHAFSVSAARVAGVWSAALNRRSVGRLMEWDDRMLKDIGLTQNDVTSALASPFAQDPSERLSVFSSERRSAARAARREEAAVHRFRNRHI